MRRLLAAAGAIGLAMIAAPGAGAVTFHNAHGLTVTSVKQLDQRLYSFDVTTKALPKPVDVRVLLPTGYAAHPSRRYPVLYLLDGTSGLASDWTVAGAAEQTTAGRQLIVVMPNIDLNGNGGGWCTDWPNGQQKWETFHIGQFLPWVDQNLRTIRNRAGRAIAGLSQGGFCSTSYAARHPDLFSVALGYSGAPDIYYDERDRVGAKGVINATEVGLTGVPPDTFFGDQASDGINWAAHDPATLAENLRWTKIYMYWGNGMDGPFDQPGSAGGANGIEELINYDNQDFQARIQSLGIAAYFDAYGNGTHSWPYWKRDLQWSIGAIMSDFAHPAPPPTPFTYTSADDSYSVYGFSVAMHRTAREFSTLENASKRGFALAGSGSGTLVTPAAYRPGARYRVTLSGDQVKAHSVTLRASRAGRLTIQVALGPPNPDQQDTPQAQAAGTVVYTTTVRIAATQR
jgi:S-formylglutathione hydrolase FrmB